MIYRLRVSPADLRQMRFAYSPLAEVWDENADLFTTAVRTAVKKLRRKLGEPDPIQTLLGSGCRISR